MTGPEYEYVCDVVEKEGIDYAFVHYSDFENVKDVEFHKLRTAYLEARRALVQYAGITHCE